MTDLRISDFDYDLPPELIAQQPPAERGSSRMLVMDRATGAVTDDSFSGLGRYLREGDLLVLNDSRVIPARLYARRTLRREREKPTGRIEVMLTEPAGANRWRALVRPGRKIAIGERLVFPAPTGEILLEAEVLERGLYGERLLEFAPVDNQTAGEQNAGDFFAILDRIGHTPLPPYIHRDDAAADRDRYQTVFARDPGSVAAPTAGLHFTPEVLAQLSSKGVEIARVTLHVGLGTFAPLHVERVSDVRLHRERYSISPEAAAAINTAAREARRIVAVGTTVVRTLEAAARRAEADSGRTSRAEADRGRTSRAEADRGRTSRAEAERRRTSRAEAERRRIQPHSGSTDIFISPGFEFRLVSALLTNFHLPQSSLLMLVSAFAGPDQTGIDHTLAAYAHAIREKYRFFSYGDCMLIA